MKTSEKFYQHKKSVLFLHLFTKTTVWYLQFCLISTNLCFSLILVNWESASSRNKFGTRLIPNLQVQDWRKFVLYRFNIQTGSLLQSQKVSFLPQFCTCLSTTFWFLFWGIFWFFFLQRIQGKIMAPVRQLWNTSGFELLENCSTSFIHPA